MAAAETVTNSAIVADYRARTPGSGALFARADRLLPSGITHDGRYLDPWPLYASHGRGSRKWCVDGHEYVDYFGGHGAMLLGHSHPAVVEAAGPIVPLPASGGTGRTDGKARANRDILTTSTPALAYRPALHLR